MKATEQELTDLTNSLLEKYGYAERVEVRYCGRLWKRIARCSYTHLLIEISPRWVLANNKWFVIRVLKHEIAHLRYHNHGKSFDKECRRMGIRGGPYIGGTFTEPGKGRSYHAWSK